MLTTQMVRDYLADNPENNHLLDDVEFHDARVELAKTFALSEYNAMPPRSNFVEDGFPYLTTLLDGTIYHLFRGQMALAARNTMSYSDGGLDIPIEERFPYYAQMIGIYREAFLAAAKQEKIQMNLESGWEHVRSDYSTFPAW
jgi:hypothetical protein